MRHRIGQLPPWLLLLFGFLAIGTIGCLDYLTGDYSLLIFYTIPISFEAWYLRGRGALLMGLAAGCARFASDWVSYAGTSVRYWNSFQDMAFLLLVGFLVSTVRHLLVDDGPRPEP